LAKIFDRLEVRGEALDNRNNENYVLSDQNSATEQKSYSCQKSPGMTAEYRELCKSLPDGIIPLKDLYELVYKPLKDQHPNKFKDVTQDVEFYSEYVLNGVKLYKKLCGKERDIAVQRDIFEQVKQRKEFEIRIQELRFKMQTKLQELSSIEASCDPAKVFIVENMMKNIQSAVDLGMLDDAMVIQLDRLIEIIWLIFFKNDTEKKRTNIHLGYGPLKQSKFTSRTNEPSSKRMKGNCKENIVSRFYASAKSSTENSTGSIGTANSIDDDSGSEKSKTSDWIFESL
jgi:hypothetical protein